jgi:hypothetical protein
VTLLFQRLLHRGARFGQVDPVAFALDESRGVTLPERLELRLQAKEFGMPCEEDLRVEAIQVVEAPTVVDPVTGVRRLGTDDPVGRQHRQTACDHHPVGLSLDLHRSGPRGTTGGVARCQVRGKRDVPDPDRLEVRYPPRRAARWVAVSIEAEVGPGCDERRIRLAYP